MRRDKGKLEEAMSVAAEQLAQLQQAQIEESIATRRQAVVELQEVREAAALQVKEAVESAQAELKSRYVCCCSHAHSWLLIEVQDH